MHPGQALVQIAAHSNAAFADPAAAALFSQRTFSSARAALGGAERRLRGHVSSRVKPVVIKASRDVAQ
jgi:hypothetical protein